MFLSEDDQQLLDKLRDMDSLESNLVKHLNEIIQATNSLEGVRDDIQQIISEKTQSFPWLSDAIAQYYELCDQKVAELLERKLHPAKKSADRVRELSREKREYHKLYRVTRNRIKVLRIIIPMVGRICW